MAAQTAKSAALTKLTARIKQGINPDVFKREIKTGFTEMPPGIDGKCKLLSVALVEEKPDTKWMKADGTSAAGELMFTMVAAVASPEYVPEVDSTNKPTGGRVKVYGLQPRKWIPCFDTKAKGSGKVTTFEEHLGHDPKIVPARDNVIDSLRKLGADAALFASCGQDVDKVVAALNKVANDPKQGIYFKYKTSFKAGTPEYPTPGVWENWNEQCDPPEADSTDPVIAEEAHTPAVAKPSANGTAKSSPPAAPAPDDADDPDALLEIINTDGVDPDKMEKVIERLTALAVAKGKTADDCDKATGWDVVAKWAKGEGADAPAEIPGVDEVWQYDLLDAKTKKTRRVDVLIVSVDDDAKTALLNNVDDGNKPILGVNKKPLPVAWDKLIQK